MYIAYELLAKLKLLTLIGTEQGELVWAGDSTKWNKLAIEEESILRDFELAKI